MKKKSLVWTKTLYHNICSLSTPSLITAYKSCRSSKSLTETTTHSHKKILYAKPAKNEPLLVSLLTIGIFVILLLRTHTFPYLCRYLLAHTIDCPCFALPLPFPFIHLFICFECDLGLA